MINITKEQADYICKQLEGYASKDDVNPIIYACVKESFPGFYLNDIDGKHFLTIASNSPIDSKSCYISTSTGTPTRRGWLELRSAIDKVVDYLESQDES